MKIVRKMPIILLVVLVGCVSLASDVIVQRAPLCPKQFIPLPLGSIRAEGWLKEQLIRQKNGLTGHLDEIYESVMGDRNGWLGGDGDQWERGPYWIDGLLPLAYILDDDALKQKAQKWVEWAIQSQQPDGYFGPGTDYPNNIPGLQRDNARDWWPKMVVLKVLQQYYMATGEELSNIDMTEMRGVDANSRTKDAIVDIKGKKIKIRVVSTLKEAEKSIKEIKNGTADFHMLEVMACPGGCVNGGGQPTSCLDAEIKEKRAKCLYTEDKNLECRKSHQNPDIKKLYAECLGGKPGSSEAHRLLHTTYTNKFTGSYKDIK